jgi:hypothetical protein
LVLSFSGLGHNFDGKWAENNLMVQSVASIPRKAPVSSDDFDPKKTAEKIFAVTEGRRGTNLDAYHQYLAEIPPGKISAVNQAYKNLPRGKGHGLIAAAVAEGLSPEDLDQTFNRMQRNLKISRDILEEAPPSVQPLGRAIVARWAGVEEDFPSEESRILSEPFRRAAYDFRRGNYRRAGSDYFQGVSEVRRAYEQLEERRIQARVVQKENRSFGLKAGGAIVGGGVVLALGAPVLLVGGLGVLMLGTGCTQGPILPSHDGQSFRLPNFSSHHIADFLPAFPETIQHRGWFNEYLEGRKNPQPLVLRFYWVREEIPDDDWIRAYRDTMGFINEKSSLPVQLMLSPCADSDCRATRTGNRRNEIGFLELNEIEECGCAGYMQNYYSRETGFNVETDVNLAVNPGRENQWTLSSKAGEVFPYGSARQYQAHSTMLHEFLHALGIAHIFDVPSAMGYGHHHFYTYYDPGSKELRVSPYLGAKESYDLSWVYGFRKGYSDLVVTHNRVEPDPEGYFRYHFTRIFEEKAGDMVPVHQAHRIFGGRMPNYLLAPGREYEVEFTYDAICLEDPEVRVLFYLSNDPKVDVPRDPGDDPDFEPLLSADSSVISGEVLDAIHHNPIETGHNPNEKPQDILLGEDRLWLSPEKPLTHRSKICIPDIANLEFRRGYYLLAQIAPFAGGEDSNPQNNVSFLPVYFDQPVPGDSE